MTSKRLLMFALLALAVLFGLWFVRAFATWMPRAELDSFLSIVSHVFAASLITVGGLQMAVTRWLADALFDEVRSAHA